MKKVSICVKHWAKNFVYIELIFITLQSMYYFFPGSHMRKWWPQKIKYPAQSHIVNGSQNPNSSTTIPSCSQGRYTREYVGAKKKKNVWNMVPNFGKLTRKHWTILSLWATDLIVLIKIGITNPSLALLTRFISLFYKILLNIYYMLGTVLNVMHGTYILEGRKGKNHIKIDI